MQTVGFNVEWSQELTLEESLEEYVKASMLIEMLKEMPKERAEGSGVAPGFGDTVFDYTARSNATPPKKVGSALALFDCLTCDKCIPVCPNDANFSLAIARGEIAIERLVSTGSGFAVEAAGVISVEQPSQIANLADACNDCGHCDVMCPEDGGPYLVKPRFFGTVAAFAASPDLDGIALEPAGGGLRMHARFGKRTFVVESGGPRLRYTGEGFDLWLDLTDPRAMVRPDRPAVRGGEQARVSCC
jgi:putative selenate reductase